MSRVRVDVIGCGTIGSRLVDGVAPQRDVVLIGIADVASRPPSVRCVCTSGGGMVRFLSGQELPVITALRRAADRQESGRAR